MGFGVGCGSCCSQNELYYAEGGDLLLLDRGVLDYLGFKLTGEVYIQSSVVLGVWRLSWVGEDILQVGCRNHPPCLRKRLFTKLVQALLGVVGVSDPVSAYL